MKIVACYIRVSTVGTTQAIQRREINRWLKSNRFNAKTVRWCIDKSASLLHRPKFDELQADILDGKVRAVVVSHLDRLATTPREGLDALIDWCEQSLRVVSVNQQIDVKSKDCTMIGTVLRGVAEVGKHTWREAHLPGARPGQTGEVSEMQQRGPWSSKGKGSHDWGFRRSIAWLSDSLSTLRRGRYLPTTQDSLPVAGQALLDGLSTRKISTKGLKVASLYLIPLSQALLGASDVTWRC